MEFSHLTRKHGFKLAPDFPCSVEDCCLAVGELVGHINIKSAERMNDVVVIFVDSVELANRVIEAGVVINDTLVSVLPLSTPATGATMSNVPPSDNDGFWA